MASLLYLNLALVGVVGLGIAQSHWRVSPWAGAPRISALRAAGLALMVLPVAEIATQTIWYLAGGHWSWMRATAADSAIAGWSITGALHALLASAGAASVEEVCALAVPLWLAPAW